MKVNTIIGILLISANLYAKSAVAVEEQLNHNLRRLAKPSCGDGKVSGKEDCEPPNTATCDANCKTKAVIGCSNVRSRTRKLQDGRCAGACFEVNCDAGTTCNVCDDPNELGCTRNDCKVGEDVCVEQSFKCVPDEITITTAATKPMTTTTESAVPVECTAVRCPNPCLNDPCVSTQKACSTCVDGDVGCTGTCPVEDVFCWGYKCEGCIEDGDACTGNCSGCCSKKSTNRGGGLGKICG